MPVNGGAGDPGKRWHDPTVAMEIAVSRLLQLVTELVLIVAHALIGKSSKPLNFWVISSTVSGRTENLQRSSSGASVALPSAGWRIQVFQLKKQHGG